MLIGSHFGLKGLAKVFVVEKGRVVREYPPVSNLILNQGLDLIAANALNDCWKYAAAGTGSTATELDSAAETVTIVAGALTVSTTGFLAGNSTDVGKNFKLTGSSNVYLVTAAGSTTQCTVTPPSSEGPDNFILYNTSQTGLSAESTGPGPGFATKRTNTYLTGAPNCQSVTTGGTSLFTRTFDFAVESSPITYNEVGFALVSAVGSNLFSRVKLPTGVPITAGQQLRVQYSVSATVSASVPIVFGTSPVIGWPTATGTLQHIWIPFFGVSTTGGTGGMTPNSIDGKYYGSIEPYGGGSVGYINTRSTAHPSYGANLIGDTSQPALTLGLSSYVSGTYTRDHFGTYPVGTANGTTWRSFESVHYYGAWSVGLRYLFNTNQTKLSTFTLQMGFSFTWGRVL